MNAAPDRTAVCAKADEGGFGVYAVGTGPRRFALAPMRFKVHSDCEPARSPAEPSSEGIARAQPSKRLPFHVL
jgi:hypothetical protein